MNIEIIDPTLDAAWSRFLERHDKATVFHSAAWARVLQETYGYRPRYFVLRDGDGEITAGLPLFLVQSWLTGRRLVGLPFSDFCAPLTQGAVEASVLLEAARVMLKTDKARYLELRGQPLGEPEDLGFEARHYYVRCTIPLADSAQQLSSRIHPSARRAIRKAEKQGIGVRTANDRQGLQDFYRLNMETRRRHGVIPQPPRFFEKLYTHFLSRGSGFILLAEYDHRVIAADVLLSFKDTLYYKFNASDTRFLELRPNNLLLWKAIELAISQDYSALDLGRSEMDNEGLRRFKGLWASQEVDLPYYYFPSVQGVTTGGQGSLRQRGMAVLARSLPSGLLRWTANALYGHLA